MAHSIWHVQYLISVKRYILCLVANILDHRAMKSVQSWGSIGRWSFSSSVWINSSPLAPCTWKIFARFSFIPVPPSLHPFHLQQLSTDPERTSSNPSIPNMCNNSPVVAWWLLVLSLIPFSMISSCSSNTSGCLVRHSVSRAEGTASTTPLRAGCFRHHPNK